MKKEVIIKTINIALILVGIYIFIQYIVDLILPFVIAWVLASILNPVVTFITNKINVARGIATLLSMVTVLSALGGIIFVLIRLLYQQIVSFVGSIPVYQKNIEDLIYSIEVHLNTIGEVLPIPDTFKTIDGIISEVFAAITSSFQELVPMAYDVVSIVPTSIFIVIIQ